ncbi:ANR family transcriptional regulator [Serratia bockelmannii]|uniref:ANR family transcriptional regulator n=1 Tax=Serratia bockelmannii TaxID=2703793 RepID=UPI003FA7111F
MAELSAYRLVAEMAAAQERAGMYPQAAELWQQAESMAQSAVTRQWCEGRRRLCLRALSRSCALKHLRRTAG